MTDINIDSHSYLLGQAEAKVEHYRDINKDLLTALRECEGFCRGHQETPEKVARYQRVRSAIARAEASQ